MWPGHWPMLWSVTLFPGTVGSIAHFGVAQSNLLPTEADELASILEIQQALLSPPPNHRASGQAISGLWCPEQLEISSNN